ncbi:MAG TPA: hypothetical protein PKD56_09975, partial [Chitinophagales bacterium]|nr:hypothetical protein [Chitinophagales bacterium]
IDNWQFRLLLHTLDLQVVKDNLTFSPKHSILEFSKAMREFYEEHFGFQFIDKNASEFTTELQSQYQNYITTSQTNLNQNPPDKKQ